MPVVISIKFNMKLYITKYMSAKFRAFVINILKVKVVFGRDRFDSTAPAGRRIPSASPIDLPEPIPEDPLPSSTPLRGRR